MTFDRPPSEDEALTKAASYLAQALRELQLNSDDSARQELVESRKALQHLAERVEQQLAQEQDQRLMLASQLTGLASALDRLVSHLGGLSQLMVDLLERLTVPTPQTPTPPAVAATAPVSEPTFPAGGEGISLTLSGVPGFQALMDMQKALQGLEQVASASVERFQEGDSRMLLLLSAPTSANDIASGIHRATGHTIVVEESRPELQRLRLKIVPSS